MKTAVVGMKFRDFWKKEENKKHDMHEQEASRRAEQFNELHDSSKSDILKEDHNKAHGKNVEKKKRMLLFFDSVLFTTRLKNKLDESAIITIISNFYQELPTAMELIEKNQIDLIITERYELELFEPIIKAAKEKRIKIVLMTGLKSDREYFAGMFDKILDYCLDDKNIKEIKNLLADQGQQENPQENQEMR